MNVNKQVAGDLAANRKLVKSLRSVLHKQFPELSEDGVTTTHNYGYSWNNRQVSDENYPVNNLILNETGRIQRIISDIYKDNQNLLKISPRQFEEVIAEILASQGFKIELTKQTRDNGYDILGIIEATKSSTFKVLVECKHFSNMKVGVSIVRSFKEVIWTEKANKGIIVTTSYFSKDAKKKQAEIPYLLDFRDKEDVMNWINDYHSQKNL